MSSHKKKTQFYRCKYQPAIVDGKRHMTWDPGDGTVGVRPFHWWSPIDWIRNAVDWWNARRHF